MQRDYSKLPARVSSLAGEIENKRVLQTEQIRQANLSMEYLLYYLSGGNEKPGFAIKDKVRPEDQDLRGWFTEQYGSSYIETFLVNNLEVSTKSNSVRVAEIKTAFEQNPYGYILRTGAVNDYHLGRIITHANNIFQAREEAKKYSKDLAIMCGKLLLSGEPPNNNIFTIMHSSIRTWYKMQGNANYSLHFEEHIAKSSLTKPNKGYNHCTYLAHIICALYDMNSYSQPADSWVVDPQIVTIIDELDGVSNSSIVSNQEGVSKNQATIDQYTPLIADAESKGWNVKPVYTSTIRNVWTSWPTPALPEVQVKIDAWTTAEANGLKIGDELPKGLPLAGQPNPINTTNRYWWNYDSWSSMVATKADAEAKLTTLTTDLTTQQEQEVTLADRHKTPIMELIALANNNTTLSSNQKSAFIRHVYDTVKQLHGLNYTLATFRVNGSPQSVFPQLIAPCQYGQTVQPLIRNNWETVQLGGIDISKTILFYAKALSGVNATAYWSNTLSYRLVFRPVPALDHNQHMGGDTIPEHMKVYLYSANMKTGGLGKDYTLIAEIAGRKEEASVQVGGFLPDTPLYAPGTNVQLSQVLNNSFSQKVAEDNSLQQWLRSPSKSQFSYAYVIKSAWDPAVNKASPQPDGRVFYYQDRTARSFLFGTRGKGGEVSSTNPAIRNGHVDWLTATTYAKQNYKGVTTFSPNLETLRYDPYGNRASYPEFYEARGALSATTMSCVALPKATSEKIMAFMKSVPAKIEELLNRVNNRPNSPWYDAKTTISKEAIFGDFTRRITEWPQFKYAMSRWGQADFDAYLDPLRTFFLNRTEALFLDDIAALVNKAHTNLKQNPRKGAIFRSKPNVRPREYFIYLNDAVSGYDLADFGDTYQEYMALLGAIAYLNSYELLTDTPQYRNYADWAKPFRGRIDSMLNPLLAGVTPQKIYEDAINDTEDVVNIHTTLKALGAFQDMVELPVFDVEEFNIKWRKLGDEESPITSSPFDSEGFVDVGLGGLKAGAYKGLGGGYGDVFHDTIHNIAVVRPVLRHNVSNKYVYSSLRVPVNTRGVSSKTYGLRPGTSLAFTTGANLPVSRMSLTAGSSGITYPKMAGAAGVVFAGMLGMAMWKNISSETAFSDKRFKIDDSD